MGHKITDVDSFGAAIGIYRAARTLEKKAYIVINNPTSSIRPLMDGFLHSQDYDPGCLSQVMKQKRLWMIIR